MNEKHSWPGGSVVACVTDHCLDKYALLEKVLDLAGLWDQLARARERSGKDAADFRIAVKPNLAMMLRRTDVGTYTDPFLVVHLLRLLLKAGYSNLTVVESGNLYNAWFHNRSVLQVAARAGLLGEESLESFADKKSAKFDVRGRGVAGKVRIVDLSLDTTLHDFGPPTGRVEVGAAWTEADYRINFAKLKSHFYSLYSLAIKNVYGCLPLTDKVRGYHCRRVVGPWTALLIRDFPVHFNIIDAITAADGWLGVKINAISRKPHTMIAGSDILAVDRYGASLLGIEAGHGVMYSTLAEIHEPAPFEVVGEHERPRPWRNSPALLAALSRLIESNANLMDFGGALATGGHDPCFPKKPVSQSPGKRALYLLTAPVNLVLDTGYLALRLRRMRFARALRRHGREIPLISDRPALIEELSMLSAFDLEMLAEVLAQWKGEDLAFSGHVLTADGREIEFPAALSFAVQAAVKVLEIARDRGLDRRALSGELQVLADRYESWFGPGRKYAYCYR